ncbi:precorrin-6A synthase (deacetylating) [Kibdelosporangium phytohabitans]|uniref:Precorrin 6A synthase n=1 Tax=Kibdelosporangium phytohabitans TaxID=860235 RepID=A0A0N9HUS8_9PSEU|nr:precorrin-6A synthase (deacetylating) [Kibdelosporangium phytohabitans]ALG07272.1 precorrin 6A synthase [Kibdelosporangium phytohabitans]MBE1471866.1 precorrin-6A synthase [Kibdelosporangium phytohabitans]
MRKILVIGVGAGDPEHITMQAVGALRRVDVFFVLDKGEVKQDLVDLRQEILRRYAPDGGYRVVHGRDPERDRTTDAYVEAVDDWRRRRADVCQELIAAELADGQTGAFLVWGDPTLYDSTLAILDDIAARGFELDIEVIPGVSSVSALVARHRVPLNQVGRPVQITTGRRLAGAWPSDVDDVVVMLDARTAFTAHTGQDATIYWGAYLGTPDEILISGPLSEVADRIVAARAEARERKGWIMDTYLLRRGAPPASDGAP